MKISELTADKREKVGKGIARKLRREGKIPAILYGHKIKPLPLSVKAKDFYSLVHSHEGTSFIVKLNLNDGETHTAIIKEAKRNPLRDGYLHIDFQKIQMDKKISAFVPIVIKNEEECKGIEVGGVLQHGIWEVEVEALPKDLPEHLEVDISSLEIGDAVRVEDLPFPEGVIPLSDPSEIVLTIVPPTVYEEKVEEVEEIAPEEEVAATEAKTEEKPTEEETKE